MPGADWAETNVGAADVLATSVELDVYPCSIIRIIFSRRRRFFSSFSTSMLLIPRLREAFR